MAYLAEDDLARITKGDAAGFVPHGLDFPRLSGTVTAIDRNPAKILTEPALASIHGGDIPVRMAGQALVPQGGYYRVVVTLDGAQPPLKLAGHVMINGQGQSMVGRLIRSALVVLVREWGA